MSRTASPSRGTAYGLARVCRIWGLSRATVHRHLSPARPEPSRRPGPVGPMPDAALIEEIRATLTGSPFHGEGHRKIWARLRHKGVRTSRRRVLRLMRAHDLLAPSRVGAPRGPRNHDGTIIPEAVDTMWGTDLTTTWTGEGPVGVFVAVDHCSAEGRVAKILAVENYALGRGAPPSEGAISGPSNRLIDLVDGGEQAVSRHCDALFGGDFFGR